MTNQKNPLLILLGVSSVFFILFLIFVAVLLSNSGLTKKSSGQRIFGKTDAIGIIELKGVITDSRRFIDDLENFLENTNVKGIVVRINSPGGSVAPSQEIFEAIRSADKIKPVFASMASLAASGGYYAALGARKIYANPGTITGSIGVIMGFANLTRLYDWAKITPYTIKTGKFKDLGSPTREMTMEDRELLQSMMDNVLTQFRKAVAEARKMPMEKVIELSDGRIFSGEQAKAVKLIDETAGMQDVVKNLAKDLGMSGKPRTIRPHRDKNFLQMLTQESPDDEASAGLSGTVKDLLSLARIASRALTGEASSFEHDASSMWGPQFIISNAAFTQ